jgi:NAD(P)-dependent dehydrogenase (short-subunit alcohol dehydrogenase family)
MDAKGTALVTGASRGLGKAIALELAARGFDVLAGARDVAAAEADLIHDGETGSLRVVELDVTDLDAFTPPDDLAVVVNNAGYRGDYLPIEHAPLDDWRKTFETNVFGLVAVTQRVIPVMRKAGRGVICNIGSAGVYAPMPFYSVYRASKAAAAAVSEGLAVELAPFGIRVIDIPIGGVDTDMLKTSISRVPPHAIRYEAYRPMAERQMRFVQATQQHVPPPAEVARAVAEAILTDAGPLRRACDPSAVHILANVATLGEEERLAMLMTQFGTD